MGQPSWGTTNTREHTKTPEVRRKDAPQLAIPPGHGAVPPCTQNLRKHHFFCTFHPKPSLLFRVGG